MWTLGLAQMRPVLGEVKANLCAHHAWVERARARGVDLLVFPELSLTGYYLRDLVPEVAISADGPEMAGLIEASRDISLVVGFVEETPEHLFHVAAAYLEGGRLVHLHRKVYLPTYGMFDEARYLAAGDGLRAFESRFGRAVLLICEDLWHPSLPYLASQERADLLISIGDSPSRGLRGERLQSAEIYDLLCRTYSLTFQYYTLFVNRVGYEEGVNFWGGSIVVSPFGKVIARAPLFTEELLCVQIDPAEVRRARVSTPLLRDERPEITLRELERILQDRTYRDR